MRYVRYLAIAILTFVVGVGISPIRFSVESIACGRNNSSTSFRSSYFMQVSSSYITYLTEAEADDAFKENLSEALTVYDTAPRVNSEGVLIEQRAVYLKYHPGNDEYYVVILWREGRTLRSISSRSYTHVMALEQRLF